VPVVQGYVLGKSQEVTRVLTDAGIPVLQHRSIYEVSRTYESLGCPLGRFERYRGRAEPGWAVIVPPGTPLADLPRQVRFALTGWAMDPAPSIASASIMPFLCRTTPTTTS